MRKLILLAGVAALASSLPAVAKPGNGGGHGNGHAAMKGGNGHSSARSVQTVRTVHTRHAVRSTRYGANSCPPGLARKNNGCLPPGQAKKLYSVGQRLPGGFANYSPYSAIPTQYRDQVPYNDAYRYIYRDNTAYVVDPRTNLITQVISLLGR
jgi:hypothetical protein